MQKVSQSSPSPLSPSLSVIELSSQCVAPKSLIIVAFRAPYRRTQPFQNPLLGAVHESPTEPEPVRTQGTTLARSHGGAVLCFPTNARFSDILVASGVQRLHQKYKKGTAEHVLGLFWALALFRPDSTAPGKKSPPRQPPSKPPPEPR